MRILLIRTSALGDVIHSLPVLSALRRHLPDATIGWVIEASMAPILDGHPDLDDLIVVRMRSWRRNLFSVKTLREIQQLRRRLGAFAADVALDLMGNHKAGALAFLSGCRRRVGLEKSARREPSSAFWINEMLAPLGDHAVDRAMSLLPALGIRSPKAAFEGDKLFREPCPEADRLTAESPSYILLSPGAGWHNKRYPTRSWGQACRLLKARTGLDILITGGPGEEDLTKAVAAAAGDGARLVGSTDLPTLAGLMRRASLFLGGDTGPLHMAHALGTPSLCVMGPTDPVKHGPYGAPSQAIALSLPCSYCYKRMSQPKACMLALPPERVAEKAMEILNAHGHLAMN